MLQRSALYRTDWPPVLMQQTTVAGPVPCCLAPPAAWPLCRPQGVNDLQMALKEKAVWRARALHVSRGGSSGQHPHCLQRRLP